MLMKLVVGLGNPGKKYKKTRHNIGFMVLDKLAQELGVKNWGFSKKANAEYLKLHIGKGTVELIKPQTYMNRSGLSVAFAKNKQKISNENIYIIHDDLDIELGKYKIQRGKGPRDHNGLLSIYEKLGTKDFWHIRVGIENRRKKENKISGEDYVLMNFSQSELESVRKAINEVIETLKVTLE